MPVLPLKHVLLRFFELLILWFRLEAGDARTPESQLGTCLAGELGYAVLKTRMAFSRWEGVFEGCKSNLAVAAKLMPKGRSERRGMPAR